MLLCRGGCPACGGKRACIFSMRRAIQAWWLPVIPRIAITLLVMASNLTGTGCGIVPTLPDTRSNGGA
jgi:hypothetical protein